jgi:hypothetical protein
MDILIDACIYVRNIVCTINARVWRYVCIYAGLCTVFMYICVIYVCMLILNIWLCTFLHTNVCVCVRARILSRLSNLDTEKSVVSETLFTFNKEALGSNIFLNTNNIE